MTTFLHVDMDAFYASVEQHDAPEYRGRPVIVGATPGHRGVVSACSYEARKFGIHSAMPISQAYSLCPSGVFLPVRMSRYHEISQEIMAILDEFTPSLQQISVDEAFLDLTGTERLFGPIPETAAKIKSLVRERTGLTISVGVAPTKYLAKLASERDKPDGLCVVELGGEEEFVAALPLRNLWGVGKKTLAQLNAAGIQTVMQLRQYSKEELARELGVAAAGYLHAVCRGRDPGFYGPHTRSHSISGERTYDSDVKSRDALEGTLLEVANTCMFRLLQEQARSRTVTLKLRLTDFTTFSQRRTLDHDIGSADEIYQVSRELLSGKWDGTTPVRLVGCGLGNVQKGPAEAQQDLFDDSDDRKRRVEEAAFKLKMEGLNIGKARLLKRGGPGVGSEADSKSGA